MTQKYDFCAWQHAVKKLRLSKVPTVSFYIMSTICGFPTLLKSLLFILPYPFL